MATGRIRTPVLEDSNPPHRRFVFVDPAGRPRVERLFRRDAAGRVDAFVDRRDNNDLVWIRVRD